MGMNNMIVDDVIEESNQKVVAKSNLQFNPPEIEYNTDKELSLNASLDKKYYMSSIIKYDEGNLDLIDYLFSIVLNNDKVNDVQGGYLVKIIQSFIHVTNGNRGNLFMKYICFKKKEILLNMMNNIHIDCFRKIILEILLYEVNSEEDNLIFEGMKNHLLGYLISLFGVENNKTVYFYREICDLLCEYIEGSKNCCDFFINDNFLNCFCSLFPSNKMLPYENIEHLLIFSTNLIKEYKIEYDRSSKFLISLSKSHVKTTDNKQNDKTILLNLDMDNVICTKMTNCIINIKKYFFFGQNVPKSFIIHFIEFIQNLVQLTRNTILLENLNKEEFFSTLTKYFFSFTNDIYQTTTLSIIKLFIDENNENWLTLLLISSEFLSKCLKEENRKNSQIFVHICQILEMLLLNAKNFLQKNNFFDQVNEEFRTYYSAYSEKMNKPLANFKNTFLYMSSIKNESDFEINNIDEIDLAESKLKKKQPKSHFFPNELIIAEDAANDDDDDNPETGDDILLGKISNEEEENENFYYDNNFWQHQIKNS